MRALSCFILAFYLSWAIDTFVILQEIEPEERLLLIVKHLSMSIFWPITRLWLAAQDD